MPTAFKIKGLTRWRKALDASEFAAAARKNLRLATTLNGKIAEAFVRKAIRSGSSFRKNRPLTKEIKGSQKPLADSSLLFQSITSRVVDDYNVFVGVLRTSDKYNVAVALHEGSVEQVTQKMRGLFFMLWRASNGELDASKLTGRAAELWARKPGGWNPLAPGTEVIVMPSRPFVAVAFRNTQLRKQARDNWQKAMEATFADCAKAGKE